MSSRTLFIDRRKQLRFNQSQLARVSGVLRTRICLFEIGDLELTREELDLIDQALRQEAKRIREVEKEMARSA
jgi:predicted transcriptional regulator